MAKKRSRSPPVRIAGYLALVAVLALLSTFGTLYFRSWGFRTLVQRTLRGDFDALSLPGSDAEVALLSEQPRLVADYYPAPGSDRLVILVHGSDRAGRKHGLVRLLADRLQRDGFSVLALDLPGYGDSEGVTLPLADDFGFEDAVVAASRRASELGWLRPGRWAYMGHSLGASVVLRAARQEPIPSAVVALGAPFFEKMSERNQEAWTAFVGRRFKDMRLEPDPRSLQVMSRYLIELDVANELRQGGLPPVLFIYGERERSLRYADAITSLGGSVHAVHIVPQGTHGYRVTSLVGGVVVYNEELIDQVVEASEAWFQRGTTLASK